MNVSIWTWMAGRSDPNRIGEHLTKGYANPDSTPGGRRGAAGFYDSSKQELWIFGGFGYPSTSTSTPGAFMFERCSTDIALNFLSGAR